MARMLSATGASRSTAPLHEGPTTIFSMYRSGACSRPPCSLAASTVMAFGEPVAHRLVPSSGSTAMSTAGKVKPPLLLLLLCEAAPTFSPMKSMGASSRSPSPMTMVPSMGMWSIILRMVSTAAWSDPWRSPRPMVRAHAMAACSTTRSISKLNWISMVAPVPNLVLRGRQARCRPDHPKGPQ